MSTALLLAESQPDTRGFLERHLRNDGFQVVEGEARPDLVLLGDSGALEECRARHGDVPVIVLGGPESDTVDRVRALDRGCDDFLANPLRTFFADMDRDIRLNTGSYSTASHGC